MTKKAIFTTSELRRMADISNAENVTVELERDGSIMRVMPFVPPQIVRQRKTRAEEAEEALESWLAQNEKLQKPRYRGNRETR